MADKEQVNELAKELYHKWARRKLIDVRWPALDPAERSVWRHVATKAFEHLQPHAAEAREPAEWD